MAVSPWIVVDVESDGPLQGENSLVCFGAVVLTPSLDLTFYGQTKPIRPDAPFVSEALAVSGFTREEHLKFPEPQLTMLHFAEWLKKVSPGVQPVLLSDNPAYDFPWINWYFHKFLGRNPFGFSARRIGDIWAGMEGHAQAGWKHMRKTTHDHNPVNDAIGNAEALLEMSRRGFKIPCLNPKV